MEAEVPRVLFRACMFRLPEPWTRGQSVNDVVRIGKISVHRAGVTAQRPDGLVVTGSAADEVRGPGARSRYELCERIGLLEALERQNEIYRLYRADGHITGTLHHTDVFPKTRESARWQFSKSNGVAIHRDWQSACVAAECELIERDSILSAWRGETRPRAVEVRGRALALRGLPGYRWRAAAFPIREGIFSRGACVVGLFGFPRSASKPMLMGFGARDTYRLSIDAAYRETLQRLAFCWGESVGVLAAPLPTPAYHLEYYELPENQKKLDRWLDEGHSRWFEKSRHDVGGARLVPGEKTVFVNLTPPWADGLRVSKALNPKAIPLTFGYSPWFDHLPEELRIHPVA